MTRARDQRGIATVLALAIMGVLLIATGAGVVVGAILASQHRVDGAADLVALSSASAVQRGEAGCDVAAQVARSNDVTLDACRLEGSDVVVTVSAAVHLPFEVDGRVRGEARAGPADP